MANTYVDYTAVASQTDYNFSFEYLRDEHVKVKVNDVIVTNYTIVTSPVQLIRFDTAPNAGTEIRIYRDSRGDFSPLVDFEDGSVLTQVPLDEAYRHNLFTAQEASEGTGNELLNKKGGANYDAEGNKIINLGTPTTATDAANKAYVDQTIDNSIALGGSPAIVSLGGYDVTDITGALTQSLSNWTAPTATGSTEPRTLVDRFADVVNVLDYGADNTGVECSAEVLSAWNAVSNTNGTLYFPPGVYRLDNLLDLRTNYTPSTPEKHNHSIVGYGATLDFRNTTAISGSLIKFGATASNQVEENSRYNLEGFHIVGPHSGIPGASDTAATSLVGLHLENAYGLNIKNVSIRHVYKGLFVKQCFPISAENLMVASSYIGTHLSTNCTFGSWVNCTFKKGRFGVVLQPHDEDSGIYGQRFDQTDVSENQVGVVIDPLDDDDAGTDSAIFNIDFAGLYMEAVHYDGVRIGRSLDETDASVRGTDRDRLVSNIRITGGMWVNSVVAGSFGGQDIVVNQWGRDSMELPPGSGNIVDTSWHDAVLLHSGSTNDNPTGLLIDIPVEIPTEGHSKKSQIISRIDTSVGVSADVIETNDVIQSKIQFGGTPVNHTDANALDDYEEGTYTPIVGNVTDSGTATTKTGYYTKVGRIVTASFNIVIGSSTTVGAMYISLPFAGNTTFYNATTVNLGHGTATQSGSVHNIMFNAFSTAATAVTPYAGTSAVGASNPFTWASGDTISGTITYFV